MDIEHELGRAEAALAAGDSYQARSILRSVIEHSPQTANAWLLLADAVSSPEHAAASLERALKLDPGNEAARRRLALLRGEPEASPDTDSVPETEIQSHVPAPPQPAPPPPPHSNRTPAVKKSRRTFSRLELLLVLGVAMAVMCVCGLIFMPSPSADGLSGEAAAPEDPTAVIYENIRASNGEDVERYMATIHSSSPAYQTTENTLPEDFEQYDLLYRISNLEVVSQSAREVVVSFVLTTRKINGPAFRDNRVTGEMILRKEDGVWKIYNQDVNNIEYLN